MTIRLIAIFALISVALASSAHAEDQTEGRRRFKAGDSLFREGRFLEAAREFEAGYAAAPRPLFLYNIGNSYRRAGDLAKARAAFEALLRLDPNLPQRVEVEAHLREIEAVLPKVAPVAPPPPVAAPPPPPPPPPLPPPVVIDSTEPALGDAPGPSRDESKASAIYRRPWLWVVAGALVVAAGVATFALTRGGGGAGDACMFDACIDERRPGP